MADPITLVSDRFAPAVVALGGDGDPVVRASDRADAQVNGALALAKRVGGSPRDVAAKLVATVDLAGFATVEVAGPGFINVTFDDGFLAAEVGRVAGDERLGVPAVGTSRTIVVDYSAPNVAKEMHVGHLRSTVIGDCLVRIADHLGHRTIRENHVGDWGTPFGMLIEHLLDLGETTAAAELSVGDLDGFYRQARTAFDGSEEFRDRARARVVALQGGDPETLRLWRLLVAESARYFERVYRGLGVLLTPDDVRGESAYDAMLPDVVSRLDEAGMLVESDGASVVFVDGFTNREGEPLPLIIRKADGGYNYATSDLACVIDRVERLRADEAWYVVGAPQAQHLEMVFAVARKAGWVRDDTVLEHVSFGNVLGADRKMLKSRSGETVKLDALLAEAVQRAGALVAEKNPDLDPAVRDVVARQVGIGAVKYADLSTDRVSDYVFDWERMLSFDGNTAPYLQYAHARVCSIFRRAGVERASARSASVRLGHPAERALALRLLAFPTALADTAERHSPHRLCTYLYDVARALSVFYEECPVLRAADDERASRLALSDLAARVLERGLGLLGIEAPEQM